MTKHNVRIFGGKPLFKGQNNTYTTVKPWTYKRFVGRRVQQATQSSVGQCWTPGRKTTADDARRPTSNARPWRERQQRTMPIGQCPTPQQGRTMPVGQCPTRPAKTDAASRPMSDAPARTDDASRPMSDVPARTDDASRPMSDAPARTDDASRPMSDARTMPVGQCPTPGRCQSANVRRRR